MKLLTVCMMMLISICSFGQGKLTGFKADGTLEPKIEQSDYFTQKVKENDTTYILRYYQTYGPMIRWETYRDNEMTIRHGEYGWYDLSGKLDSAGYFYYNNRDGYWRYRITDTAAPGISEEYNKGTLVKRTDNLTRMVTLQNGQQESLDKPLPPETSTQVFTVVQIAASFKGGIEAWAKYLGANIKTPDRFVKASKPGTKASVVIEFLIEPAYGRTAGIFIYRSCEFSVDMETIRVIKAAPAWTPAVQNGKKVIYRHRQSITYSVSN